MFFRRRRFIVVEWTWNCIIFWLDKNLFDKLSYEYNYKNILSLKKKDKLSLTNCIVFNCQFQYLRKQKSIYKSNPKIILHKLTQFISLPSSVWVNLAQECSLSMHIFVDKNLVSKDCYIFIRVLYFITWCSPTIEHKESRHLTLWILK